MIALLLTAQLAMAQESEPPGVESAPSSEESTAEAEARLLLDLAQRRISSGQTEMARELLEELLANYGDTSVAASARTALAPLVDAAEASTATEGRVQLAISQTIMGGLTTGLVIPTFLERPWSEDPTTHIVSALAGMGAGIGGSYLYTRNNPITRGEAWTFALGESLGLYHGIFLVSNSDMTSGAAMGGTLLLSEVAGGVAGAVIASRRSPSMQDVSLVTSAAGWGALNSGILLAMFEPDSAFPVQVAITDAGVVTGILLARAYDLSPRRLSLINSAGVAGVGVGLLIGLAMEDEDATLTAMLLGEAAGLTLGTLSTKSMQAEYDGRIVMSAPQLRLRPEKDGSRSIEVSLLNGRF
ncbi:MAG: hypothetical protein ACI8S6_005168 [Myxococcota bacterium]|jgi:hypothetical protein